MRHQPSESLGIIEDRSTQESPAGAHHVFENVFRSSPFYDEGTSHVSGGRRVRSRQPLQRPLPAQRCGCCRRGLAAHVPLPVAQVLAEKAKTATHPAAKAVAKHAAAKEVSHAKSKENYGADILQVCVCVSVRACAIGFTCLFTAAHESRVMRVRLCGASPVRLRRPCPDGVPVSCGVPR